jgi:ADP-ribose pyrophosphatase
MQSENVLENAKRELEEETGIRAGKLMHVGTCYVAPGHETTRSEVVLATELDTSNMRVEGQEGDEDIRSIRRVSQEELDSMVRQGDIRCGITLAALKMLDTSRG